jgi:hypothetical protein
MGRLGYGTILLIPVSRFTTFNRNPFSSFVGETWRQRGTTPVDVPLARVYTNIFNFNVSRNICLLGWFPQCIKNLI